jgi:hypothetical protein
MTDRFDYTSPSLSGPAAHGFAITPNDASNLAETTRAIYVGSAGDIALTMQSGATITLVAVNSGTVLPVRAIKILATGTTAASLVGLA